MSADGKPVLWHIPVSHYNEKVRWALDHKRVGHTRRAPLPPSHIVFALALTRGAVDTFPVLRLDGRNIGDSTAILAALEERYPDPPLYPSDPAERERALELEDFFDEELGPHIRLYAYHELLTDPDELHRFAESMAPGPLRRGAGPFLARFLNARFGVADEARAEEAKRKVLAALDRLEAELDGGDYLVGETFTVADLSAASLFYPLATPPEAPTIPRPTEDYERFRAPLTDRPGYGWIQEMFARHRRSTTSEGAIA